MTSHQWMRVVDLSLPEMQTQLLSKIELVLYILSIVYYLLRKGAAS